MEPLSSASAVFAVGTVASELVKAVHKLDQFLSRMKDAPADVAKDLEDLKTLSSFIESTGREFSDQDLDKATERVLVDCEKHISSLRERILKTVVGLESDSYRKRKFAAFNFARKKEEIDTARGHIEQAKLTLTLVLTQ